MTATTPQNLDLLAELTSSFSTPISPTPPSTTEGEPDPNLSASLRKKLLKEQRKREKDERKANAPKESATPTEKGGLPTPGGPDSRFKVRKWIEVEGEERHERDISLFSWNVSSIRTVSSSLFQCLVMHELGSFAAILVLSSDKWVTWISMEMEMAQA